MNAAVINLGYLGASALFVVGLKGLAHPRTAQRGNLLGSLGMLLAVALTLLDRRILGFQTVVVGMGIGAVLGAALALKIHMTAMPQMVALLNGFGGGASVFVAGAGLLERQNAVVPALSQFTVAAVASGVIGAVTFSGSLVAFAKLQELVTDRSLRFPGRGVLTAGLAAVAFGLGLWLVLTPEPHAAYWLVVAVSSLLGLLLVLPVGGADMPVVIALLNSCSGLAAATTGFALNNNILIIAGSLVGASGFILTQIMCRAMNRSLVDVMTGIAPPAGTGRGDEDLYAGRVKAGSPEEVALLFAAARRVVIVPGYGMAVSQAQHSVAHLTELLHSRDIEVEFAIHPVAGRMPGHMNVLLAEANIPYELLKDLDDSNPTFEQTDVVLVIGANDVVNPLARTDRTCPIAGMPILDVDKAQAVVVIKRSLSPGFAGIPNPLFAADKTIMLFGDGREMVQALLKALKEGP
ncbi:MAG: NAD(P)(+) transhydrogenase (Re/Si-specific) subunit beta [Nitrospira sp.]|nr:NAD(P)(+) transhydrogenase (Re/Si-specific) subunit beta [Nitrospira sp.]MDH4328257.1 NAD(P)(+) transhydrogenase (Re/Si-specific) subunit beta [Nitrospira sp.]